MTEDNLLTSENKRSYFLMLPLMVDDLNLSPQAFRLYAHIVRRVGDGGECWENTANMARCCCMSTGAVSKAKAELVKAELIRIEKVPKKHGEFPYDLTTLIDIWAKNFEKYATCSQCEPDTVHNVNSTCSQCETKKIPVLSKAKKTKSKTDAAGRVSLASRGKAPREGASPAATGDLSSGDGVPAGETSGQTSKKPSMRNHESIQTIKRVTGYYPAKALYLDIIRVWESVPYADKALELEICYKTDRAKGYNPGNLSAWYFDWFAEGMAYVPDDIKRLAQQFRENLNRDIEET